MKYFAYYLLIINLIAFIIWCADKQKAKKHKRRISEKALFLWALFGGSVGSLIAMYTVRHKTLHRRFTLGIPFILLLQIILILFITKKV